MRFANGPDLGSLIDCTITVDDRVVLEEEDTTRCTWSEGPRYGYLLAKGVP